MKLVTAEQMREIDRITIEERGVPAYDLMDLAGRAVAMDVADHFEQCTVLILCGGGNNGGDGFVAARYLCNNGWDVHVLITKEPSEGGAAHEAFTKMPEELTRHRFEELEDLASLIAGADVVIDALLGTGAKGRPRPPFDSIIETLNAQSVPVIAVDSPSGLDVDTGRAELAVEAWRTVTIGLPKIGMMTNDGPRCCGSIRVEPISFPVDLLEKVDSDFETLTFSEAAALLPDRPHDGHKGTFGKCLIMAGTWSMPGAAILTGMGALRGGCGLVMMHVSDDIRNPVANNLPEALLTKWSAGTHFLKPLLTEDWEPLLNGVTSLAVGPGLGTDPITLDLLVQIFDRCELPIIFDADALNLMAANPYVRSRLNERHVITPHPGELARLLNCTTKEIQADRWAAARRAAEQMNCTVLLKGAGTIIAEPGGHATHIPSGNSALSRGGAGDILTGLIGSLLAQGMAPADAAKLGAFVHGLAADILARNASERSALIREIADCIPDAFGELEEV